MADCQGFNSYLTAPGPNPSSLTHSWELHKSTVKKLYFDRSKSLEKVMKIMEMEHNFKASKKVYRRKLAKWGFEKKIKGKEREVMVRKLAERGAAGKNSTFTLRGRRVPLWVLVEYPERTKKSIQNISSEESSREATPPHLRCWTPESSTWEDEISAGLLQKFAEDIEAYKMRSTQARASAVTFELQDNNSAQPVTNKEDSMHPSAQSRL